MDLSWSLTVHRSRQLADKQALRGRREDKDKRRREARLVVDRVAQPVLHAEPEVPRPAVSTLTARP